MSLRPGDEREASVSTLHVFIDESGRFSPSDPGIVGGFVVEHQALQGCLDAFRDAVVSVNTEVSPEEALRFPGDIHMAPLHKEEGERNKNGRKERENDRFPANRAGQLFSTIFEGVRPYVVNVFTTNGQPPICTGPMADYMEVLELAILSLVSALHGRDTQLRFHISSRNFFLRNWLHTGDASETEQRKARDEYYRKHVGVRLLREVAAQFGEQTAERVAFHFQHDFNAGVKEIKATFGRLDGPRKGDARYQVFYHLADSFVTAQSRRYRGRRYLADYESMTRVFDYGTRGQFSAVYTGDRVKRLFEYSPAAAALELITLAAPGAKLGMTDTDFNNLCSTIFGSLTENDKSELLQRIEDYLNTELHDSGTRYARLDTIEAFTASTRNMLLGLHAGLFTDQAPRISLCLLKADSMIKAHRGGLARDTFGEFWDGVKELADSAWATYAEYLHEKCEFALTFVQQASFNRFDFEGVENQLDELYREYRKVHELAPDFHDNDWARIRGTQGQMYAMLAEVTPPGDEREEYWRWADDAFTEDERHAAKDKDSLKQVRGYRTTLAFKRGDLEGLTACFAAEAGLGDVSTDHIVAQTDPGYAGGDSNEFYLLHRLYVCALAARQGRTVARQEPLRQYFMQQDPTSVAGYPTFLSLKWLAWLEFAGGNPESAHELLSLLNPPATAGFTTKAIMLPLLMGRAKLASMRGKTDPFRVDTFVKELADEDAAAAERVKALVSRANGDTDDDYLWNTFGMMPFYFS